MDAPFDRAAAATSSRDQCRRAPARATSQPDRLVRASNMSRGGLRIPRKSAEDSSTSELPNDGHDTRSLPHYFGHRKLRNTAASRHRHQIGLRTSGKADDRRRPWIAGTRHQTNQPHGIHALVRFCSFWLVPTERLVQKIPSPFVGTKNPFERCACQLRGVIALRETWSGCIKTTPDQSRPRLQEATPSIEAELD
jgi:hypothetical protein